MKNSVINSLVTFCLSLLLVTACSANHEQAENNRATLANPAVIKCIDDGFKVEPINKNGITRDHVCINPKNGKRCGAWPYFRGECTLTEK